MLRRSARFLQSREERIAAIENNWKTNPRWNNCIRPYTAEQVVELQGSLAPEVTYAKQMSDKAFNMFTELRNKKSCEVTFGALDPVQVAQMANGVIDTIMAGHASAEDLAAVGIGSSLWMPLFLFFMGMLGALTWA